MNNRKQFLSGRFLTDKVALLLSMISCLLVSGCTKKNEPPGVASLNVFNGIVGTFRLAPDLSETSPIQWYKTSFAVLYGNAGNLNPFTTRTSAQFNSYSGEQRIKFFNFPDTLAHSKPLLDLRLDLPVGSINSLFLTGKLEAPDTLFIRNNFPYHPPADSVASIRIVNLVPGLKASINLKDNPAGSELASLAFKSVSAFRDYPVIGTGTQYVFEVRDATSGNLVTTGIADTRDQRQSTSSINYYRFKNFTMIIYGELGNTGAGAPKVAIMSNN